MSTKKAIFFDIDGTLIDITKGQLQMTAKVQAAIMELRAEGHHTFIASGRPYSYLDPELRESGAFDGFVLMNGAAVILDGKTIFSQPLLHDTVMEIIALCKRENVQYILQGVRQVYLHPEFHELRRFYADIGIDTDAFLYDFEDETTETYKMEIWSEDKGGHGIFKKLLAWPGLSGLMDPFHKQNMEVYASDISKASGILHALDYMKIPVEQSYAFGDGLNDLEMMDTVGTSFAMGNGQPEVKARADIVVPGIHEDGVAWGIRHKILGER